LPVCNLNSFSFVRSQLVDLKAWHQIDEKRRERRRSRQKRLRGEEEEVVDDMTGVTAIGSDGEEEERLMDKREELYLPR
jgi:hypothetical protein